MHSVTHLEALVKLCEVLHLVLIKARRKLVQLLGLL